MRRVLIYTVVLGAASWVVISPVTSYAHDSIGVHNHDAPSSTQNREDHDLYDQMREKRHEARDKRMSASERRKMRRERREQIEEMRNADHHHGDGEHDHDH